MNALLLVAHGSRRPQSNDEVVCLADRLRESCNTEFGVVRPAFLELAAPSIPDGIDSCVEAGATRVIILPYFLNSGRHVVEDIPEIVAAAASRHPHVDLCIAPHLGASTMMTDLLVASARSVPGT